MPGESAYLLNLPAGRHRGHRLRDDGAGAPPVTLWQREAYDARKDYLSFFRGALLGVSVLLAAALFALYGFRARAAVPGGGRLRRSPPSPS